MPTLGGRTEGQTLELDAVPDAVRKARRFTEGLLQSWPEPTRTVVVLLVSELATNAVLHARTPFGLTISTNGPNVRVAVADRSQSTPILKDFGPEAVTGRGMRLVDTLSRRWGTEPHDEGKTVWFELEAEAADREAGGRLT
jgi:anti-sigma regulatory factor (Ser/Thr protein kinase)